MDIFFSGSILAFVEYSIHFKTEHIQVQALAQWSSGMIPASGAGGPGFKSRLSPNNFAILIMQIFEGFT